MPAVVAVVLIGVITATIVMEAMKGRVWKPWATMPEDVAEDLRCLRECVRSQGYRGDDLDEVPDAVRQVCMQHCVERRTSAGALLPLVVVGVAIGLMALKNSQRSALPR